jgi:DNA gyrase inhibitor GyrI
VQLDAEVFKFRNHAHANDRRQANWNASFSQWLAKSREYSAARPGFGGPLRDLNRDPKTGRAVDW